MRRPDPEADLVVVAPYGAGPPRWRSTPLWREPAPGASDDEPPMTTYCAFWRADRETPALAALLARMRETCDA